MGETELEQFQKDVIVKARQEVSFEAAEKMLQKHYDDEEILEVLNISREELNEIKHKSSFEHWEEEIAHKEKIKIAKKLVGLLPEELIVEVTGIIPEELGKLKSNKVKIPSTLSNPQLEQDARLQAFRDSILFMINEQGFIFEEEIREKLGKIKNEQRLLELYKLAVQDNFKEFLFQLT